MSDPIQIPTPDFLVVLQALIVFGWAMVRDPLLAVPLAGNPAFEALKREVDPPN